MLRFLVLTVLACVVAFGVQPAAAATKRTCPKAVSEGAAVIPGESWFVRGMSCAAGKKVLRRYNRLAASGVAKPAPYGYRCGTVRGDARMVYCKKSTRRVDFWPAVSSDNNG